ncbi:DUF4393 domain-containing protein [Halorientalis regularis]|jgi:hypothetical protein|uniref:DUF4393 domain-containing protein n=1 Tax=Halorientalis regularis TaxID=660518 RepID=A0A1G7L389_9EURY|nr:DUF4393 domain-containing protein [Halorientalis regularis]SDF43806.1 protein of unknown function [Halorientalis regularis]
MSEFNDSERTSGDAAPGGGDSSDWVSEIARETEGTADTADALDPSSVVRLFDILDVATTERDLGQDQVEQLLDVLEASIVTPTPMDTDETERLISVLESTVVDPVDPDATEEALSVLNTAIVDPTGASATRTDGVLSVIESAMTDPTVAEEGIEEAFTMFDAALATLTDPSGDSEEVFSTLDSTVTSLLDPSVDTDELVGSLDDAVADMADPATDSGDALSSVDRVMSHLLNPGETEEDKFSPPDLEESDHPSLSTTPGDLDDSFRVARIGAAALQRSTGYSVRSGVRTGPRLVRAAATSESMVDMVEEVRSITLDELDRLGVDTPAENDETEVDRPTSSLPADKDRLQRRGARLMEASADVDYVEEVHPAYASILDQVAPDEVRILRLLATEGRQPSMDVRDVGWVPISSELVAAGLTMIGNEAGCQHLDRVHAYLNNLKRLGLIWFSDEPVEDLNEYQVLQAQPDVQDAIEEARRAKLIRRSIHLTPFGVDFCREVLPIEVVVETAAGVYETPEAPESRDAPARPEMPEDVTDRPLDESADEP